MVTLKDFVAQTLVQIVDGAIAAQKQLEGIAEINPDNKRRVVSLTNNADTTKRFEYDPAKREVEFDVFISAKSDSSTSGNAGVKIFIGSLGAEANHSSQLEHHNRVRFSIPLTFNAKALVHDLQNSAD